MNPEPKSMEPSPSPESVPAERFPCIAGLGRCLDARALATWRGCTVPAARRWMRKMQHYGKGATAFTWEAAVLSHLVETSAKPKRAERCDPLENVIVDRTVQIIQDLVTRGVIKLDLATRS